MQHTTGAGAWQAAAASHLLLSRDVSQVVAERKVVLDDAEAGLAQALADSLGQVACACQEQK